MIRFKNSERSIFNKALIFLSNFIRKLFGGDRLQRINGEIVNISKEISQKKKKKITVLDFGCGSMNVSRKLNKYSFIKQIVGIDTFFLCSCYFVRYKYIERESSLAIKTNHHHDT